MVKDCFEIPRLTRVERKFRMIQSYNTNVAVYHTNHIRKDFE